MVSNEHKMCLLNKKIFVDRLSYAISNRCGQVINVKYEAYECKDDDEPLEFIIVTFKGGAIAVRNVHRNSHSAILRELGNLVDGGYYSEVKYYKDLQLDPNWEKVFPDYY